MSAGASTKQRVEFGDFQTPPALARDVCRLIRETWRFPASALEPTCGVGAFLLAASREFQSLQRLQGVEINSGYAAEARSSLTAEAREQNWNVLEEDFFAADWKAILDLLPDPLLVIGNPPWVTNSTIGSMGGDNLPTKANTQRLRGLDAITGKSNFDISEWMIMRLLELVQGRDAAMAMLCKTSVARKILKEGWSRGLVGQAEIRCIDAKRHFNASVDACLLFMRLGDHRLPSIANVFDGIESSIPLHVLGMRDNRIVSDVHSYDETSYLFDRDTEWKWRSGVKHDCAAVMELRRRDDWFVNGLDEMVKLEEQFVFPALKCSDVASGRTEHPSRWMIVTQTAIGEDTHRIAALAPQTWAYLQRHASRLDARGSSIYRGRPPFSIFGVGDYTFSEYKVAISGLHKRLQFRVIGPFDGKPVVLDDACSFLPCRSRAEAEFIGDLLATEVAQRFFKSRIFWDSKRPITSDVLNQLDLVALASDVAPRHPLTLEWNSRRRSHNRNQMNLF